MCDLANLENLDGAELVRVFTSKEGDERVYAWFGGVMVTILDGELNELDVFNFDCSKNAINNSSSGISILGHTWRN